MKVEQYKLKASEADIKKLARDYMQIRGWFIIPILQSMGCYPGISDFISIKAGRVVFIEIKKPGKSKQRPGQIAFQDAIEAKGGEYFLVDCYEDLLKITELKGGKNNAKRSLETY